MALEPHEFQLLSDTARLSSENKADLAALHGKVDGLFNQRWEDKQAQAKICKEATDSRKELHGAVDEYRADKRLILTIFKWSVVVGPAAYGLIVWLRRHGINII